MSNGSYNSNFGGRDAYGRDRNEPGSSSSAFSRSSGQSQQQTTQGNLPQYAPTTRRSQQPSSQAPTVYYDDQFGQLPSASGYAQVLPELEDYDTSNTRRSHSSHSKGHGSQQKHKRPHH
ncbi:hypothetical protein CH063_10135 [Colletotrichum higginsianum]|uniref:Uncharacterized protein n=1 Tax=Colletotrichum higginsianum (strain IMI 349063) TaxID=759273 RepID=H1VGA7_COLHI|nr:hypothetical protein CH063_10135 [Colletotrichum higginsianum]